MRWVVGLLALAVVTAAHVGALRTRIEQVRVERGNTITVMIIENDTGQQVRSIRLSLLQSRPTRLRELHPV